MGEIGVGGSGDTLVTLLGSCVAVVLFDPRRKRAGLAHIQLPESHRLAFSPTDGNGKYADTAIPELLGLLTTGDRSSLIAHLAGGADMYPTSRGMTVGRLNIQAAERLLIERRVPIVSSDCGGILARRVRFDVATGKIQIDFIEKTTGAGI